MELAGIVLRVVFDRIWLWIVPLLVFHELGHAVLAGYEDIYEGWGILPNPHIELKRPYGSRWGYLSGIAGSLLAFPFFSLFGTGRPEHFVVLAVVVGSLDVLSVVLYDMMDEDGDVVLFDTRWITDRR